MVQIVSSSSITSSLLFIFKFKINKKSFKRNKKINRIRDKNCLNAKKTNSFIERLIEKLNKLLKND